jgi:nucleoside-diphosphate-sugar epimerase
MKILVIGGTGFIGPYVIRDLLARGHEIAVFHRGETPGTLPDSVRRIRGNRNDIAAQRAEFERFSPAVVVDFILA